MDKIIQILKPFYEITKMLSKHDASISVVTPCVTFTLDSLEENRSKVMSLCFPFMWFFMDAVVWLPDSAFPLDISLLQYLQIAYFLLLGESSSRVPVSRKKQSTLKSHVDKIHD